jgi:hypothetical protein
LNPTPQQLFEMERTASDALSQPCHDVDGDLDSDICEKIARLFWERHIGPLQRLAIVRKKLLHFYEHVGGIVSAEATALFLEQRQLEETVPAGKEGG